MAVSFSETGRHDDMEVSVLPKLICGSSAVPIRIAPGIPFGELGRLMLESV